MTAKVTIRLTHRSADALAEIVHLTGSTKTEVINTALRAYAYILEQAEAGGTVHIQPASNTRATRLQII